MLLPNCDAARDTLSLQGWLLCQHCAGIHASIALAPLPALRWHCCLSSRRHHCQHCAGVFALHALVLLTLLRWRHCPSHTGFGPLAMLITTHPHCRAGIFANAAQVSLQALRWRCHSCCAGVVALVALPSLPLCWHHHQHHSGICALALASLPSSCWCLPNHDAATCCSHRAGILAGAALVSLQALSWCHC